MDSLLYVDNLLRCVMDSLLTNFTDIIFRYSRRCESPRFVTPPSLPWTSFLRVTKLKWPSLGVAPPPSAVPPSWLALVTKTSPSLRSLITLGG